jgi:hypothetical protein
LWAVTKERPDDAPFALRYGTNDLVDRFDLLAMLYHDSGDLDRAILTLVRSKSLCERFGVPFEGGDLLREYLSEKDEVILRIASPLRGGEIRPEPADVATPTRPPATRRTRAARGRRTGTAR